MTAINEDVQMPDIPVSTDINNAKILGLDSTGAAKNFSASAFTGFEAVNTFADVVQSGPRRLIFVLADETNGNDAILYIWTGTKLTTVITQDL